MTIKEMIQIQIRESEEETIRFNQEETEEDISNMIARRKYKELRK
jgi:hypothetical protein